jgi:hypothetical protein
MNLVLDVHMLAMGKILLLLRIKPWSSTQQPVSLQPQLPQIIQNLNFLHHTEIFMVIFGSTVKKLHHTRKSQ